MQMKNSIGVLWHFLNISFKSVRREFFSLTHFKARDVLRGNTIYVSRSLEASFSVITHIYNIAKSYIYINYIQERMKMLIN